MVARLEVVAVLLAAGGGTRFTGPTHKLLAPFRGRRVVDWAHEHAVESGLRVIVVTGAVPDLGLPHQVHNPAWADGIATSLQVAVAQARDLAHDAVVVGLGDQPGLGPDAWRGVAAAPDESPIAVATYAGRRGNPVRLGAAVWDLLPPVGDEGARALMRGRPDLVREVPCSGEPDDVDTVEDLERWS